MSETDLKSFVTLRMEDWSIHRMTDRAGNVFEVQGYVLKDGQKHCPTDECHAVCCKTSPLYGQVRSGQCEFHTGDLCKLHAEGGASCKPVSCLIWPKTQLDIDTVNELADQMDLTGRCVLKVVQLG